jgi:hypothetical protein
VNNTRAKVAVLPYDDHDRAIKLLHHVDRTVLTEKVEPILESEKYKTLMVYELFSKLKSFEVDRGVRAKIENPTDPHSLALVSGSRTNANMSSRHFSLSCLVSMPNEEFDVLGVEDLTLLSRRFKRMYTNRKNAQRSSCMYYQCGKHKHFIAKCLVAMEVKPSTSTIRGPSTSTIRGPTTSTARGMTTRLRLSPNRGKERMVVTRRTSGRWLLVQATSTQAPATPH